MDNFRLDLDPDGILTAALDVPGRSMNTITHGVIADLTALAERLTSDATIKALVLTSGKSNGFCAGADLGEQSASRPRTGPEDATQLRAELERISVISRLLRKIETCGKPVAAAINGLALGGGLEILLAAHYRVAADDPGIQLGLPESKIGLLPGAGGTQRLPRLIGLEQALNLMLDGNPVNPAKALKLGVLHSVVPAGEELAQAKNWIRNGGNPTQPWDRKGYKIPGGNPYESGFVMAMAVSQVHAKTFGNYPAQLNILKCVYEGSMVPIDAGLRIEARYFVLTAATGQAKAMARTLFLSMQALKRGETRPKNIPVFEVKKLAVLGAGMMGAGIALVSAEAGIDVILLDRGEAEAEKGKTWIAAQLAKAVEKKRMSQENADAVLARVTPTIDYSLVEGADYVVEAVFEDRAVKAEVTKQAEPRLSRDAVFGSNTSGLAISSLALHSTRPENFIGIHFFSPADRMRLVEIIRGEQTSDITLAKTIDFVKQIKKTPIVVNDSPGFYTTRTVSAYVAEGFELLADGVAPAIIDNIGRATGMPRGPLELTDDAGLDLCDAVRKQAKADFGDAFVTTAQDALLPYFMAQGRYGRKTNKGFYDYFEGATQKRLWLGLAEIAPVSLAHPSGAEIGEIKDRLLYCQAVEAARAFAEGVVTDPRAADVGAILGWGFPGWTGGPLSLIDQIGTAAFVARADFLAEKHGRRFVVPAQLRDMAARQRAYYE